MNKLGGKMEIKTDYTILEKMSVSIFKKHIDTTQMLFKMAINMNKKMRYLFYFVLVFGTSAAIYGISFIFDFGAYYDLSEYAIKFINIIGFAGLCITVFLMILILGYESIITNNLNIEEIEDHLKKIEIEKKQWWRLRNMNFFLRFISYLAIWFFSLQIYYYFMINFIVLNPSNFKTNNEALIFLGEQMSICIIVVTILLTVIIVRTELIKKKAEK
jgi:hypothetical protein